MKDYLNDTEERNLMIIITAMYGLLDDFFKFVSKQGQGNFKRGRSFIINGINELINNVGEKSIEKMKKKAKYCNISMMDEERLKILSKKKVAKQKAAYEESKEYFDLVELTMDMNCKNCCKDWKQCDLCKHFDENEVIPYNDDVDLGNCKYAYKKE